MYKRLALTFLFVTGFASAGAVNSHDIYPDPAQASGDIETALQAARQSHRRVIVDFGANWCPDCHVLDSYLHDATNAPLLDANFVLVHVNVGLARIDSNQQLAERYHIPLKRGVPALAVLDPEGHVLFSQESGQFEAMRGMQTQSVTAFLNEWKPHTKS